MSTEVLDPPSREAGEDRSAFARRGHQEGVARPARHAGGEPRGSADRRHPRRRHAAHQVPRQLHAGRSRPARRARASEARACLQLHDPHAPARRYREPQAVAGAVATGAHLRHGLAAPDHAPGLPAARRDQERSQDDDAGHERRAHRFHRRLRRRESQCHGGGQPGGEPRSPGSLRLVRQALRASQAEDSRLSRDLAQRREARRPRRGRAHPRPALSTAQVQDRRGGAAAQRRGRLLAGSRLHCHPG